MEGTKELKSTDGSFKVIYDKGSVGGKRNKRGRRKGVESYYKVFWSRKQSPQIDHHRNVPH